MIEFVVHTIDSAPAGSRAALRVLEQGLGFVPNLAATMAGSSTLVSAFVGLRQTMATSELTGVECEIVALAVSFENNCDYCMAAHSTLALMQNADGRVVATARSGAEPDDPKLGALYRFARTLMAKRGHVSEEDSQSLLAVGYSRAALLDVVGQAALTTMANFAHSLTNAVLDDAFAPQMWRAAAA